jgi:hypothetical protein
MAYNLRYGLENEVAMIKGYYRGLEKTMTSHHGERVLLFLIKVSAHFEFQHLF